MPCPDQRPLTTVAEELSIERYTVFVSFLMVLIGLPNFKFISFLIHSSSI